MLPLLPASSPCSAPSFPRPEAHSPSEGRAMSRLCSVAHSDPSARTVPLQLGLPGDPAPSVHALTRNVAGEAQPPSFPLPSARISSLPQSRACPAAYAGHTAAHAVATPVSRARRAAVPGQRAAPSRGARFVNIRCVSTSSAELFARTADAKGQRNATGC